MKLYRTRGVLELAGKDASSLPCVELDDGTLIAEPEILLALIKALIAKGTITQVNIKAQLVI